MNKKAKRIMLLMLCVITLLTFPVQSVAAFQMDLIYESESIVENLSDENIEYNNVTNTNYRQTYASNSGISTRSTLNWTVKAGGTSRSTSSWTFKNGDFIDFDLTSTPSLSTSYLKIGIYNVDTQESTYMAHSSGVLKGKYYVKKPGTYKITVTNNSSQPVTISGSFYIALMNEINVPLCAQEEQLWCWAACSEMIAEYYSYSVTQRNIVFNVKGNYNDQTGGPDDIKKAIEYATSNKYTSSGSYTNATSVSNIANEIKNSRPVIMFFELTNGNHVCVATGVDNDGRYVKYNNPSPVNSGRTVTKKYSDIILSSSEKYSKYMTITKK